VIAVNRTVKATRATTVNTPAASPLLEKNQKLVWVIEYVEVLGDSCITSPE
jgi:hypothetical protein